jgi:hypothetical protein
MTATLPGWRLIAVAMVLVVAAPAHGADTTGPTALHGTWEYVGDDLERQARLESIERTVQQMSRLMRAIARSRITASTEIPEWVKIEVDGDDVTLSDCDGVGRTTRWDGTPLGVKGNEDPTATLTRTWDGTTLTSQFQEPKGSGTDVFRPSTDGQTMTLTVTVASQHLPSDIVYDLTYRRR